MSMRYRKTYAKLGDWNVYDERSGYKYKASEMAKDWNNAVVHKSSLDGLHPLRKEWPMPEPKIPSFMRPGPNYRELSVGEITPEDL